MKENIKKYWWIILIILAITLVICWFQLTIGIIFVVSLIFGLIKYYGNVVTSFNSEEYREKPWQWKFIEIWNCFVNFFLGGLIGYYFVSVRWGLISQGEALNTGDFVLIFIFVFCVFGHFVYLIKNITEGIYKIIDKLLGKIK